ncbi:MAG: TonB-dependent receptor [Candidatus Marinimicrobia bacterium]|nr:TonB-dependent receptor [Candidatus Neomarinimicrobiota bacterium]
MHQAAKHLIILLVISALSTALFAQAPQGRGSGQGLRTAINGKVMDHDSKAAVQYANIMLHKDGTGEAITGTITDEFGRFEIAPVRPGRYFLTIKFMGYEALEVDSVTITFAAPIVDIGDVFISPATVEGESVVVERERTTMEYKIDKKVINVGQDLTSSSGTAVEVLENVPSVSVDIEGNVELRGSSNFTVLIDNRPSILDANDALQTIPASTIDNIEIITNPSAAYDPDGVTGIINIITKKSKLEGVSGFAEFDAGMLGQMGGDFLINYRGSRYTAYISAAYHSRVYEGSDSSFTQTTIGGSNSYVEQIGDRRFEHGGYRLRTGIDYSLTDSDVIGIRYSYGNRGFERSGTNAFKQYSDILTTPILTTTDASSERGGEYSQLSLNYEHQFGSPTHRLEADLSYSPRASAEESITEQFDISGDQVSGTITTEKGPTERARFEVNYEQPFANDGKIEAGYQIRAGFSADESGLETWDSLTAVYIKDPLYDHDTDYERDIQSMYGTISNNFGKLGVQAGFRAEYTFRDISVTGGQSYSIDRWDYYPTLHLSYSITPTQKFMASYSRRVRHPRGWYLEPFETWMDAYNVRMGNPGLEPVFSNSIEAGYMHYMGKNMISAEIYSRESTNLIERIQTVYGENIILHSFDNVGNSLSLGSELTFRMLPTKWWDFNLMGNLYHYEIHDQPASYTQELKSTNWSLRFNNNFKVNKFVRLQMNAMYNSPTVTAQGEREAMFFLNAGARLTLIENKLNATINVRDLLDTGDHENTTEGLNFTRFQSSDRVAPIVSASIKYTFNNYRSRDMNSNGVAGESDEGDDF